MSIQLCTQCGKRVRHKKLCPTCNQKPVSFTRRNYHLLVELRSLLPKGTKATDMWKILSQSGEFITDIMTASEILNLPKVVYDDALRIFLETLVGYPKEITSKEELREGASLLVSCILNKNPRLPEDIIGGLTGDINPKDLLKEAIRIGKARGLKRPLLNEEYYLACFKRSGISDRVIFSALRLLQMVKTKTGVVGKSPKAIAATALYVASKKCGDNRTQREIAEISHVSEVTIRNNLRLFCSGRGKIAISGF